MQKPFTVPFEVGNLSTLLHLSPQGDLLAEGVDYDSEIVAEALVGKERLELGSSYFIALYECWKYEPTKTPRRLKALLRGCVKDSLKIKAHKQLVFPSEVTLHMSFRTTLQSAMYYYIRATSHPATLQILIDLPFWQLHSQAASHANLLPDQARQLFNSRSFEVARRLALNPATPPHLLSKYALSDNLPLRALAAQNPNLPSMDLETLAQDSSPQIKVCVAKNPSLSYDALTLLGSDPVSATRMQAKIALKNRLRPSPLIEV